MSEPLRSRYVSPCANAHAQLPRVTASAGGWASTSRLTRRRCCALTAIELGSHRFDVVTLVLRLQQDLMLEFRNWVQAGQQLIQRTRTALAGLHRERPGADLIQISDTICI